MKTDLKKLTPKEFALKVAEVKNPTVVMHVNPDGDTVGTAAALLATLRALGKTANYACAHKIPKRLEFLLKEYNECASLEGRDIIAVDVASPAQLGELSYLADEGKICVMIDHHEIGTPYADNLIIPGMSSTGEVLYLVIRELEGMGKVKLDKKIAEPLYAAISSDTGRFSFASATPDTYRRAASLIELGIDHAKINHNIFNSKPIEQITADGIVASKLRTECKGKVAYVTISMAEIRNAGLEFIHFDTAIDIVRSVMGAEISFIVKETEEGKIKASLRSTGMTVSDIAASFGGGGHALAAGCTLDARTVEEGARLVIEKIKEKLGK